MLASVFAAKNGHEVHVFEKNDKLGNKLCITGKGRWNLTNACETEELFTAVVRNHKFLYSGFYSFSNHDVIDYFEQLGVKTKIERGNRVFPLSDHSSDIIRALENEMKRNHVRVHLNTEVKCVVTKEKEKDTFDHVVLTDGEMIHGDSCIVATGGISYQTTGSTGDGYRFAKKWDIM